MPPPLHKQSPPSSVSTTAGGRIRYRRDWTVAANPPSRARIRWRHRRRVVHGPSKPALPGVSGGTPGYRHRLGEPSAGRYEPNPEAERPAIGPGPANSGQIGRQTPGSAPCRRSCCRLCARGRRPAVPRRPLGAVFDRRGWQWLPTHQAERASGGAAGGARFTAGPNPRYRTFQGVPQGTGTGLESPQRAAMSRTRRPNDLQSAQGRPIRARQGASRQDPRRGATHAAAPARTASNSTGDW